MVLAVVALTESTADEGVKTVVHSLGLRWWPCRPLWPRSAHVSPHRPGVDRWPCSYDLSPSYGARGRLLAAVTATTALTGHGRTALPRL